VDILDDAREKKRGRGAIRVKERKKENDW